MGFTGNTVSPSASVSPSSPQGGGGFTGNRVGGVTQTAPKTHKGSDGVDYTLNEHGVLVNRYGHVAPAKIQAEYQGQTGQGPLAEQGNDFKRKAEFTELEEEWNKLTPEEQQGFLATNPAVAGIASFIEGIAPLPVLWLLPDGAEAQVRNAIKENPAVAGSTEALGTVVGLVGGPLAAAKGAKGLIKLLRKIGGQRAGHKTARLLKKEVAKLREEAKDLLRKKDVDTSAVKAKIREGKEVESFLKTWGNMIYDQRFTLDQRRDFLTNSLEQMPVSHPVREALRRAGRNEKDLYDSFWHKEPLTKKPPEGFIQNQWYKLKYRGAEIKLNAVLEVSQFAATIGGDLGVTFLYAFQDFLDQGKSTSEAATLAWAYVLHRTPADVLAEVLAESGVGNRWVNLLLQLGVRAAFLPELGDSLKPTGDDLGGSSPAEGGSAEFLNENVLGANNQITDTNSGFTGFLNDYVLGEKTQIRNNGGVVSAKQKFYRQMGR